MVLASSIMYMYTHTHTHTHTHTLTSWCPSSATPNRNTERASGIAVTLVNAKSHSYTGKRIPGL